MSESNNSNSSSGSEKSNDASTPVKEYQSRTPSPVKEMEKDDVKETDDRNENESSTFF